MDRFIIYKFLYTELSRGNQINSVQLSALESGVPMVKMMSQLALHFVIVSSLIFLTPLALYGSLCKTCLTLAFKCKTAASMVHLKAIRVTSV